MPNKAIHTDKKIARLIVLTSRNGEQLVMKDALKIINREFPREKIKSVSHAHQLTGAHRKKGNDGKVPTWEGMLAEGVKLRREESLTHSAITERLQQKYKGQKVPCSATILAHCRRRNAATNGDGKSGKSIKIFSSSKKGYVLVELPVEEALRFVTNALKG